MDLFFGEFIGVDHGLDLGGNVLELVPCSVVVGVGGAGEGGEGVALGGVVVGGKIIICVTGRDFEKIVRKRR